MINLNNEKFREKIDELKSLGGKLTRTQTVRLDFVNHNYFIRLKGSYRYLYTKENFLYTIYATNIMDDSKNNGMLSHPGKESIVALQKEFKEKNGLTLRKAFGYVGEEYKTCIPKSFVYMNMKLQRKIMHCVSSIDGCSQYPSSLCGDLPDSHDCQFYTGTVKPNAEYPFAFYLKSGHIAQYQAFDSHNWKNNYYYNYLFDFYKFNGRIEPEDDETVLMAKSQFRFDDLMQKYYDQRKDNPEAKMILNSTIGYFHTKNYKEFQLAHLAAVCIARSNQKMLDKIVEIGIDKIIQIVVDGIMYIGDQKFGQDKKQFGKFYQEYLGCSCYIRGMNAYIIKDGDKVIKVKHGAYNKNKDGSDIEEDKIKDFHEADGWIKIDYFDGIMEEERYDGEKEIKSALQS